SVNKENVDFTFCSVCVQGGGEESVSYVLVTDTNLGVLRTISRGWKAAGNLCHNTHAIHTVGFKPRSYRIRRVNGIHEVGGSIPLGSTTKKPMGTAFCGPHRSFWDPRKVVQNR